MLLRASTVCKMWNYHCSSDSLWKFRHDTLVQKLLTVHEIKCDPCETNHKDKYLELSMKYSLMKKTHQLYITERRMFFSTIFIFLTFIPVGLCLFILLSGLLYDQVIVTQPSTVYPMLIPYMVFLVFPFAFLCYNCVRYYGHISPARVHHVKVVEQDGGFSSIKYKNDLSELQTRGIANTLIMTCLWFLSIPIIVACSFIRFGSSQHYRLCFIPLHVFTMCYILIPPLLYVAFVRLRSTFYREFVMSCYVIGTILLGVLSVQVGLITGKLDRSIHVSWLLVMLPFWINNITWVFFYPTGVILVVFCTNAHKKLKYGLAFIFIGVVLVNPINIFGTIFTCSTLERTWMSARSLSVNFIAAYISVALSTLIAAIITTALIKLKIQ
ncbi:8 TM domain-containing transmembrane protein [Acrasis kona]|uniref:8 TM domain-containing transmembrane protein n=1 Tax=Acrasis kona TaxID=1008807 RepID=A0AAW2Z7T1_9EUKA